VFSIFPYEWFVRRRGSPLVIGVKSATKLATDRFPVIYSKGENWFMSLEWLRLMRITLWW